MKLTEKIMKTLNDECKERYKSKVEQEVFLFGVQSLREYSKKRSLLLIFMREKLWI